MYISRVKQTAYKLSMPTRISSARPYTASSASGLILPSCRQAIFLEIKAVMGA